MMNHSSSNSIPQAFIGNNSEIKNFYDQIIGQMPGAFYVCDAQGYITYYNEEAANLWGQNPAIGKDQWCGSWKIFWPDGTPCPLESCPMAVALREGRIIKGIEIIVEREDGQRRNILPHPRVFRDETGAITGAFNILVDITERKIFEHRIHESEHFLQRLIASSSDCIKVLDLEARLLSMNDGGKQLIEVSDFSLLEGIYYPELWENESKKDAIQSIQIALDGGTGKFTGYAPTLKTNTPKWWHVVITPILNHLGKPEKLLAVSRDITEQKKLERKISEKNKSLEIINQIGKVISSELELAKIVQKVTDAATQISEAEFGAFFYNMTNANGEFYTLYTISGAPREAFDKFPHPRKTQVFGPTFAGHGIIRVDDITKDPRYGKNPPFNGMPQGHLSVVSYMAIPVISRTGEVLGGLFFGHSKAGVFSEQTEEIVSGIATTAAIAIDNAKLYEASKEDKEKLAESNGILNLKNIELQKINNDLDNFIYTASHDLKAPVCNLEGLLESLQECLSGESLQNKEVQLVLSHMNHSILKFRSTVEGLTEISKVQQLSEEHVKLSCKEIIEDVLFIIQDKIRESKPNITIEIEQYDTIVFSRKNLHSIVYNLLSNSIKYRSLERPLTIAIKTYFEDGYTVLSVEDNGLGISTANQQKLFKMFTRFHDHVEGTGIGLYIIKRIIDNAGGKIEVESIINQGTTFRIYFTTDKQ